MAIFGRVRYAIMMLLLIQDEDGLNRDVKLRKNAVGLPEQERRPQEAE
jgi:hypothetical protein